MRRQPIELVVLDMAGTTIRDDDSVNDCLREALNGAGVNVTRDQVNEVMGLPKPTAIDMLLDQKEKISAQAKPARVKAIHDDFLRRMIQFYEKDPRVGPMPYAAETMRALKNKAIKIVLDTGFSRPIVDTILKRIGWDDGKLIDGSVASDEVPRGRPHPDLIVCAMRMCGVANSRAVAKVGDTPSDLQEGTAAQCGLVIGVTNGSHTKEELLPHPHTHLIESLKELPDLVLKTHAKVFQA